MLFKRKAEKMEVDEECEGDARGQKLATKHYMCDTCDAHMAPLGATYYKVCLCFINAIDTYIYIYICM